MSAGTGAARIPRPGVATGRFVLANWAILGALLGWQLWVALGDVPTIVAPSPLLVAQRLVEDRAALAQATLASLSIALPGLALGVALGCLLAAASHLSSAMAGLLLPGALVTQSVPIVALTPVIAPILGYNDRTVLAIAVLISFFPTFVLVRNGLAANPPGSRDVAAVLGASALRRLWRIELPSAVPNLATAVRLAAANCILATLVAEFLMGTEGLGHTIASAAPRMDLGLGWSAALIAVLISVGLFAVTRSLEAWAHRRWT